LESTSISVSHAPVAEQRAPARRVFRVLFVSIFAATLGLGIISPLMPIYAESLGATGIWLGLIFSGFSLARLVFMPVVGRLSDRVGRKIFIVVGLLLYTAISLLYVWASNVVQLTLVRLFHGFASAMVIPIAMAYVGDTTPRGHEGARLGTFNIALFLGMGSGPFLGGALNDALGINAVFYSMAALTAFAFLTCLFFLPPSTRGRSTGEKPRKSWATILRDRIVKALLLFRAINAVARGGILAFLPLLAVQFGLSSTQLGVLLSANVLLTAALQRPFGVVADKVNRYTLVLLGSVVTSVGLLAVPLMRGFLSFLLLSLVIGGGGAVAMPAATAITAEIGQWAGMGTSMGLFNMAMSLGMILAPLISGAVMDLLGLEAVFLVAGAIGFAGTILFYVLVRDLFTGNPGGAR